MPSSGQRKTPSQAQSQSGQTWPGDLSQGVARGLGERWALDAIPLPAEETGSLAVPPPTVRLDSDYT